MPKKTTTNKKHTIVLSKSRKKHKSCLKNRRIPRPKKKVSFSLEIILKEQMRLLSDDYK